MTEVVHRSSVGWALYTVKNGTRTAVSNAFSPMAIPANVPASGSTWNARAVPMPWAARPAAKPRARLSIMCSRWRASGRVERRCNQRVHCDFQAGPKCQSVAARIIAKLGHAHSDLRKIARTPADLQVRDWLKQSRVARSGAWTQQGRNTDIDRR
jgi:hypothetical protein